MTLGNFTKKIKQIKWYYQGTAAKVLYVSFPWQACLEMRLNSKVISPHYDLFFALDNDFMDVYISQDSLRKTALYYYNQQRLDSSFFISFNRSWQDNFSNPYLKVANKIIKEDLYRYSDKELQLLINDFFNKYLALWQEIIFLDGFDFYGHKIIQEIISDLKIKNSDLNILLLSFSPSSLQKERLSLLNLAEKVIKNRQNKNLILNSNWEKIKRLFPLLARQLNHHANQYYWLHNDYASVTTLDSRYFLSGLKEIIKNPKLFKKEKELKLFLSKLLSQKRKLIKKYKLNNKTAATLSFLAFLSTWRDERKTYTQIAGAVLKKIITEAAQRLNCQTADLENLFFNELLTLIKIKDKKYLQLAKERNKSSLFISLGAKKYSQFYGAKIFKINQKFKKSLATSQELKGQPAYPGIVRGKAKIIRYKKEFIKMKPGDILIAPNTRPDYVPIMKMAGAIITDEGGVTCHAAITSRELKIPTIVGVQGATTILQDGDEIEVDAKKGIINFLNKK